MTEKQFVKKFIINNFHCSEYFFESVWKYVKSNYKKSANLEEWRQSISDLYDKSQTDKQQAAFKTTSIFFEALKELVKTDESHRFFQNFEQICEKHGAKGEIKTMILSSTQEIYDIIRNKKEHWGIERKKPEQKVSIGDDGISIGQLERINYEMWNINGRGKEPLSQEDVDEIKEKNKNEELEIFVDENGVIYFNGKEVNQLKKAYLLYKFLIYFLKNKGVGGSYENLFLEVWPDGEKEKFNPNFKLSKSRKRNVIRMKNRLNTLFKNYGVTEIVYEYNKYRFPEDFRFCVIEKLISDYNQNK